MSTRNGFWLRPIPYALGYNKDVLGSFSCVLESKCPVMREVQTIYIDNTIEQVLWPYILTICELTCFTSSCPLMLLLLILIDRVHRITRVEEFFRQISRKHSLPKLFCSWNSPLKRNGWWVHYVEFCWAPVKLLFFFSLVAIHCMVLWNFEKIYIYNFMKSRVKGFVLFFPIVRMWQVKFELGITYLFKISC